MGMLSGWFRINSEDGQSYVEGNRSWRGLLELSISIEGEILTVRLTRDNIYKLTEWLIRTFPDPKYEIERRNVIRLMDDSTTED